MLGIRSAKADARIIGPEWLRATGPGRALGDTIFLGGIRPSCAALASLRETDIFGPGLVATGKGGQFRRGFRKEFINIQDGDDLLGCIDDPSKVGRIDLFV